MKIKKERLKEKVMFYGRYLCLFYLKKSPHTVLRDFFATSNILLKFCSSRNSSTLSSHIVVTEHVQGCDSFEYICLQFVLEYFCSQAC